MQLLKLNTIIVQEITLGHQISFACNYHSAHHNFTSYILTYVKAEHNKLVSKFTVSIPFWPAI